jgi:DNA polymerase III alpha subunit (gram-positive type)
MEHLNETFVSIDVETAGPNPSQYSLLTIGACTIEDRPRTFYLELKPLNEKITPESFALHRLSLKRLAERGLAPADAMASFEKWLKEEIPADHKPVFVAFNAPFSWMFDSALDIKAFFMGLTGAAWEETTLRHIGPRYLRERELTHHALRDAMDQAEIFQKMLAEAKSRGNNLA